MDSILKNNYNNTIFWIYEQFIIYLIWYPKKNNNKKKGCFAQELKIKKFLGILILIWIMKIRICFEFFY